MGNKMIYVILYLKVKATTANDDNKNTTTNNKMLDYDVLLYTRIYM